MEINSTRLFFFRSLFLVRHKIVKHFHLHHQCHCINLENPGWNTHEFIPGVAKYIISIMVLSHCITALHGRSVCRIQTI